jgi:hypothetical protein
MNRIATTLDQFENALEPACVPGNTECCAWYQAVSGQANDVSQVKILEFIVVRDVQKTGVGLNVWLWHSWRAVQIVK